LLCSSAVISFLPVSFTASPTVMIPICPAPINFNVSVAYWICV
jgi:hypothetical protein